MGNWEISKLANWEVGELGREKKVVEGMRIMWGLGDFVANYAKGGVGGERAGNQEGEAYPSFIVRL